MNVRTSHFRFKIFAQSIKCARDVDESCHKVRACCVVSIRVPIYSFKVEMFLEQREVEPFFKFDPVGPKL